MARIALIARLGRRQEMQEIARQLRAGGDEVVSRWIQGELDDRNFDGRRKESEARINCEDLASANVAVAFTERRVVPGAERGGRHVDFGYALALCPRIIVVGPRENMGYWERHIEQVDSVVQLLALLRGGKEAT